MINIFNKFNNKENSSFTLIELSIVMVIIGLIMGGVLIGQELIHISRVQATVSQVMKYNTLFNIFQQKYNALPGDFINASTYISGAVNGNGNNLIAYVVGPYSSIAGAGGAQFQLNDNPGTRYASEVGNFWSHMTYLGLEGYFPPATQGVNSPQSIGVNFPKTTINNSIGIIVYSNVSDNTHYYHLGITSIVNDAMLNSQNFLSPGDALGIDNKIDDGNPISGIVVARGVGATFNGLEAPPSMTGSNTFSAQKVTQCLVGATYGTDPNYYNTAASSSSLLCQLRIKVD